MTKEQRERNRRQKEKIRPAYDALMKVYPFSTKDLDGEIWKPIAGYEQLYHVSNFGRIKSFWGKTPRILKPELTGVYLSVQLHIGGKKKHFRVHMLVAKAFIPNPDNKPFTNHRDGQKFNNYVENFEWVTVSENIQHAYNTGLHKSGTENVRAKIKNAADIVYIRENPDGLTLKQLANKFGVVKSRISDIQRGKKYKTESGTVREKIIGARPRIPKEIRERIRADYSTGKFSIRALAKKYGYCRQTIRRILHEGIN
ncbi:MAG: HNH endonuclease [Selenomonadaceae bacterium]|nr:HNH endonuclease [Selenomonadaceae bacterium]